MRMKPCSALLAAALVLSLCPAVAFADDLHIVEASLEQLAAAEDEQPVAVEAVAEAVVEAGQPAVAAADQPAAKHFNSMSLRVSHKIVKAADVKKAKRTLTKAVSVVNAQGAVEFSKPSKRLCKQASVNKKTGAITVKKGTKADTYSVLVKVTAAGDATHLPMTKAALVRITVK